MFYLRQAEDGTTAVEYALIVTLICVVIVSAVVVFGNEVVELFEADWP